MNIKLENIGIIKDSTIAIDGLTVITGKNNSGKTTVGKTLYSLLDAVCNIRQKAEMDRYVYIKKQLDNVQNIFEDFSLYIRRVELKNELFADYPNLGSLFTRGYRRSSVMPREEIEKFAHSIVEELKAFDIKLFENISEISELSRYYRYIASKNDETSTLIDSFNNQRAQAISILERMFLDIDKDLELIDYTRESINQTLRVEFENQIQPAKSPGEESRIRLSEKGSVFFSFAIADNQIVNDGHPVYTNSPYKKVYFIDNPFILDDLSERRYLWLRDELDYETILNPGRIVSHNDKLTRTLKTRATTSILEKIVLDKSLKVIKEQIDQIIPGTFKFSEEGNYYVQNDVKLKISNLATGSKLFSIIKLLLEKGELDKTTMLILDEPEAHLHPKWQNSFAELMALLVKKLNVNILLTTHSPNFMLALDAYMRRYDMSEKTNFYQTESLDDGFVRYNCVNDDMGKIYQDFVQYLSEMKVLRNKYLSDVGE